MKHRTSIILIILLGAIAFGAVRFFTYSGDFLRRYPINVGSFHTRGSYKIDPDTILSDLEHGNTQIFQLEQEQPQAPIRKTAFAWTQAEYQSIANALHQFVWKETPEGWNLELMRFHTPCQDNPSGFDYGDFIYFREISLNGKRLYTAREIFITPQYEDVSWGGDTNFPRPVFGWKRIDLDQVQVTAEEALKMAEATGGKEARMSVQNRCQIYVSMNPQAYGNKDWRVSYGGNSKMPALSIRVPAR